MRHSWFAALAALATVFSAGTGPALAQIAPPAASADAPAPEAENAEPIDASRDATATIDADIFARDSFRLTPIVCPFKGAFGYKPTEISCGLLEVPENRERPRARRIQLHYVKLAARKPLTWDATKQGEWRKRDDPVIYLTGGPGVTVTGYARRLRNHAVRDVRDMYILEQRGVGYSGDYCPLYFNIDPAAQNADNWDDYQRGRLKTVDDCFAAARARGVDLTGYNSIENARDVAALRRALGIAQWNVWGISYGSILGQAYLKTDPDGIRAAVIDAIVPLKQGANFQRIGTFLQRDLDLLSAACDADETCRSRFPDITGRLKAATAAVQKSPIVVDALDTELAPSGKVTFFHDIIAGVAFQMFYEEKNYPTMPAFIDALADIVEKGDFRGFQALTAGGGGGLDISQGMYNAILCNDGWAADLRRSLEEDQAAHPLFSSIQGEPWVADELVKICRRYGLNARPAEQYAPVETSIRTIIANGRMDPITPPELARSILPGFSNGTYVEFPYAGHGPTRSMKCGGEFLTKFFDDPNGKLDTSCADDMKAPKFEGPLFVTQGHLRIAAFVRGAPERAGLIYLWLGLPVLFLIYAGATYLAAPVARLINGASSLAAVGARPLALLTAATGAASALGFGLAAAATAGSNEFALLAGFLGWARWCAWAGVLSGGLGAILIALTVAKRARVTMPIGVLAGRILTGAAALAYASFLVAWGLAPF